MCKKLQETFTFTELEKIISAYNTLSPNTWRWTQESQKTLSPERRRPAADLQGLRARMAEQLLIYPKYVNMGICLPTL